MTNQQAFSFTPDRTGKFNTSTSRHLPLAVRLRPSCFDDFVGQRHIIADGLWLKRAVETDTLGSIIVFGPAGTGKTSFARLVAHSTQAVFVEVSAVGGNVSDLRREIEAAQRRSDSFGKRTILFVDEIHRFNRSQQDALLHAVENRSLVLIGATTENPSFEVNAALLSRSRVVEFKALEDADLYQLLERAEHASEGLDGCVELEDEARQILVESSGGDARVLLGALELAAQLAYDEASADVGIFNTSQTGFNVPSKGRTQNFGSGNLSQDASGESSQASDIGQKPKPRIDAALLKRCQLGRPLSYDKDKDSHYDIVSAFIKSMRGSDPDAAIYWLARMIAGGEDPRFIARRMMICASEDIGNADPQALLVAHAAFKAAEVIGHPECRINLAQAAIYLALAPKSNVAEVAIDKALADVRQGHARAVPNHLRDRHRPGSERYGSYLYPHDYPSGWVAQRYLPEGLHPGCFVQLSERGWEAYRHDVTQRDYREV